MTQEIQEKERVFTSYYTAVHWLHNNFVLCNNVLDIDEGLLEQLPYDEESEEFKEIFQYYITDASESDVNYLQKAFGLEFAFSDKLDCYILLVDHWGTGWKFVPCEVNTKFEYAPHIKGTENEYKGN